MQSPIFVSHGAPDLGLHPSEVKEFLTTFGPKMAKPKAILMVSAHFETQRPALSVAKNPEMIYDFGGFDPKLREIIYPAPGDPVLARHIGDLLRDAGIEADLVERGFDHGTWVPLALMLPDADIPVVTLSVQPHLGPKHHYQIGQALQPLNAENVLVIGSGSLTHNLQAIFTPHGMADRYQKAADWVIEFADWIETKLANGDVEALLNYRDNAPHAAKNHPTDEHLLPLFVALGAAGNNSIGKRLHSSEQFGALMMDMYRFKTAA
ncbi:MAG: dioxygenase [Rhizobiales bacterium]|nr:dioxygenase [Hyphomicrobiales bacterium]